MAVAARIVRIGNSQGVRIPKALLEQSGIGDHVELEAQDNVILIRRAHPPRAGWAEAFAAMAREGDDAPLEITQEPGNAFDDEEWRWPDP